MSQDEKVIGAMPVYNFNEDRYITIFTKDGMVKRTKLIDFKVGRWTKEIGMINLKDDDRVVDVSYSNNSEVFVATRNGFGLWYDVNEISVVGIRASGVKSIKLKDDEVVSSCLFNSDCEYITIIMDKGTAKRLKLSEVEKTSRANRGILLMKEIKSNPSKIIKTYLMPSKEEIVVNSISGAREVKLTEISIMDRQSNGSFVVKDRVMDTHKCVSIMGQHSEDLKKDTNSNEEFQDKKVIVANSKEVKSLKAIDDKIMTIDEILNSMENKEGDI